MGLILALDFGGTKNSAAVLVPGESAWRELKRTASPARPTAASDWQTMLQLVQDLMSGQEPEAIGVSFGGPVRAGSGEVVRSDHVPGWESNPLAGRLTAEFGAPAAIDNDANAAALGEARFGAGRGASSLLYVTVSTGVGGGWVLGGRVWRGADEMAGEIGHLGIEPAGPVCVCGRRGCVEVLAAGPAIARQARAQLEREPERASQLRELTRRGDGQLTAQLVSQAAQNGDALAREVLLAAAAALGRGIGAAIVLMNPQRVVLGGGVTKSGEEYWGAVREAARASCRADLQTVEIVPATLGDDAPLWGAVALAQDLLK